MKKLLFSIFILLITANAWAMLTFTCTNPGDFQCKVSEPNAIKIATQCDELKKIDQNTVLHYDNGMLKKCKERENYIKEAENCPYVVNIHVPSPSNPSAHEIIFFCITNPNVLVVYTNDDTKTWSINQKKCVGSGGKWINGSCDCGKLSGTEPVNNECLCTNNPNQQYFNKLYSGCKTLENGVSSASNGTIMYGFGNYDLASIDKANSCSPTGGTWSGPERNECICNTELNLQLHEKEYFCECKNGTDYIDPLRKYMGCQETKSDTDIEGVVVDESTNKPIFDVNVCVANDSSRCTKTDTSGEYTLNNILNTADITFSINGYETQTINIRYLSGKKTIELVRNTQLKNTDTDETNIADISKKGAENAPTTKPNEFQETMAATGTSQEIALDDKAEELAEKFKTAKDALSAAQEKENSWANRAVSAVSTAATGLGAMEVASALAERKADKNAEAEMQEYISTMKCEYGNGQEFNFGTDEITLPGGNELLEYYTEYKTLADNLKTTKAALGLRPGIESEVLYDRAQSGLYQYSNAERQSGGETSLYRALTDTESADATAWNDQKDASTKKLYIGGGAAAVGVVGGAAENYFINRDKKENNTKK